jgi:hypothetical protein|tara:strand:- start:21 stop:692 length:672 start_codon:yes stop_codon:yes gene_type:complete
MANLIIICGKSGSGKSTSGRNLDPKTTLWLNCDQKALPFKGWKKNYSKENKNYTKTSNLVDVVNTLKVVPEKAKHIKTIVIDTINRLMTDKVMGERHIKGFEKWSNLSGGIYDVFTVINKTLPDDIDVFVLAHSDEGYSDMGAQYRKVMTAGKQLDKIVLESMSSVVLFTAIVSDGKGKNEYFFQTQTDGTSTAKSPVDMFSEYTIPNDMQLVKKTMHNYYNE